MTTTTAPTGTLSQWTLDPAHTQVGFEVKHMVFATVRGHFTAVEGTLVIAPEHQESTASVTIGAASIDTGQAQRDEHLRSPDFFDVDRFPHLVFEGKGPLREDGRLLLVGRLTLRDVTRRVELEVEELGRGVDPWGNERIGFAATTTIDRRDYGLTWNQALETGGILVGNEIRIVIEAQAVRGDA